MARRTGLDIKKAIIKALKEKECSLRELETKVDSNYLSIKAHCKELEYFGFVEIIEHNKSENTGRSFTTVKITMNGRKL